MDLGVAKDKWVRGFLRSYHGPVSSFLCGMATSDVGASMADFGPLVRGDN